MYRSDDGGSTWFSISDAKHLFGGTGIVVGDRHTFGKFYLGCGGRGLHYGTIPYSLNGIFCSPSAVTGGTTAIGTVTLLANAPIGGAVLTLSSDNPAVSVPSTITVPAGGALATFAIGTSVVGASTVAKITASDGTALKSFSLTVNP